VTPGTLEDRAAAFAGWAHRAQKRKGSGHPYINHPAAVAEIVRSIPHDEEMVLAAWLHDTVEDTEATIEMIEADFGKGVAELVSWLTDVSKPTDGGRATRKALDRAHTAKAPPRAKTVKLADLLDNSRTILENEFSFARLYVEEKVLLLDVLREGDPILWARADELVMQVRWLLDLLYKQGITSWRAP